MNKAQIKAKKRRKKERDRKKRFGLFGRHSVPTLDEYFAKGGGGPWRKQK